jgi:site-specific DNA-methyltransferase (adenine-specific)
MSLLPSEFGRTMMSAGPLATNHGHSPKWQKLKGLAEHVCYHRHVAPNEITEEGVQSELNSETGSQEQATESSGSYGSKRRREFTSTVGRGKAVVIEQEPEEPEWNDRGIKLFYGDSLNFYDRWETPITIVSDGGYGVLGFEGDTSDHLALPDWYEPHVREWSKHATPATTLWFWNSEIGWAAVHPVLERHGWRYMNANIWDKGKAHIAGNVNTAKIRRFPVVTEVCVQYSFEARVAGLPLKNWLLQEWKRTGLPVRQANTACGVADAAVRKYLDQGHLWYWPPVEKFEKLVSWANEKGDPAGRPYFSRDGKKPMTGAEWAGTRTKFRCPHGVTNVWSVNPLHGEERIAAPNGRAVHLNQKPLSLVRQIVEASTDEGDVVWEPFGGLFGACVVALKTNRRAFGGEIDPTYFHYGRARLIREASQLSLL